jgi:hypothetical protein
MFTLAVGGCFAFLPEAVGRQFDRGQRRTVVSAALHPTSIFKSARVDAIRQIGVFLIAFTCYGIYLWFKTG